MKFLVFFIINTLSIFSATLEDTLGEIRSIANARVHFNQSWVTFLEQGHFGEEETVPATVEERANNFIETFFSNKKLTTFPASKLITEAIRIFKEEIIPYTHIIGMIDNQRNTTLNADCLFAYLHVLFCSASPEAQLRTEKLRENYWLRIMRDKLSLFTSPQVRYFQSFLRQDLKQGKWIFDSLYFKEQAETMSRRLSFSRQIMIKKLPACDHDNHTTECMSNLTEVVLNTILNNIDLRDSLYNPFKGFIDTVFIPFVKSGFQEKLKLVLKAGPLVFENYYARQIIPFLTQAEQFDTQGQEWKVFLKTASCVLRRFEVNCCDMWRSYQASLKRKKPKAKKTKAPKQLATLHPATEERTEEENAQDDFVSAQPTAEPEEEDEEILLIPRALPDDSVTFIPAIDLEEDLQPQALPSETPEVSVLPQVPSFQAYLSVKMILDTRGPVNYDAFERQLKRDFRGKVFEPKIQHHRLVRQIIMTLPNGKTIQEYAFYDKPHGAQLLKAWPQWRIAYRDMFKALAQALPPVS